ncbi:HNH endonuclease [Bacillus sp. JJ722]|uniref:HNH endonuclease n=1 Tax=Bacillus sp. JJ722 TaxID=3122973 RepID=UPI002FFD9853
MDVTNLFKMPTPVKITGRTSSITNAFVNGIIPCIVPTDKEIRIVLEILGMNASIRCAYCGGNYTEWDHFRPLIHNKRPTGYISEIHNLVPACGKCNQSKGNSYWRDWILSDAKLSPKTRNIRNLNVIINHLEEYEARCRPTRLNFQFQEMVGKDLWEKHWENCEKLHRMMHESQKLSDKIKDTIAKGLEQSTFGEEKFIITKKQIKADIEGISEKKEGVIAQTVLKKILESNKIPITEIQLLQTQEYSKSTLNLNYPLLKEINYMSDVDQQKKDHKGRNRYYKTPIVVNGKKYLLCSQWYNYNRQYLLKWIELYY